MSKRSIIKYSIVIGFILLFLILDQRICPIYNIVHIPCPGCGLTRAIIALLKGHIKESINYNILGIPIIISALIYIFLLIAKKQYIINDFMSKHKIIIITLSVILVIIVEYININNPLLYD